MIMPTRRCPTTSVQAGLEHDDQDSETRADGTAHEAASDAKSAATARREAVNRQQDGAGNDGNPGCSADLCANELSDEQDDGGHKGRGKDRPRLGECLFQCVYGCVRCLTASPRVRAWRWASQ